MKVETSLEAVEARPIPRYVPTVLISCMHKSNFSVPSHSIDWADKGKPTVFITCLLYKQDERDSETDIGGDIRLHFANQLQTLEYISHRLRNIQN